MRKSQGQLQNSFCRSFHRDTVGKEHRNSDERQKGKLPTHAGAQGPERAQTVQRRVKGKAVSKATTPAAETSNQGGVGAVPRGSCLETLSATVRKMVSNYLENRIRKHRDEV